MGYSQQDFLVGAPLLPEELTPLPSAERRVLAALNGFDGRWQQGTPNPGDATFAAEVATWRQAKGVSEVQAALYRTLAAAPEPGHEMQWQLDKVHGKRRRGHACVDEVKQWLGRTARQLLGITSDARIHLHRRACYPGLLYGALCPPRRAYCLRLLYARQGAAAVVS